MRPPLTHCSLADRRLSATVAHASGAARLVESEAHTITLEAIANRRSVRKFESRPIPREDIERILTAATQAPSAKNGQPWRFVVLEGGQNRRLAHMMLDQAEKLKVQGVGIGSLEWTAKSMLPAPVTIVAMNAHPPEEVPARLYDDWNLVMLQSTGAATVGRKGGGSVPAPGGPAPR